MRQIGDLWVWLDRVAHRLMLGNHSAALAHVDKPSDSFEQTAPVKPASEAFVSLGCFALPDEPAVELRLAIDPVLKGDPGIMTDLLAGLRCAGPPAEVLEYSAAPSGRALWRNGAFVASGPLLGEGPDQGFTIYFELVRALLAARPLTAILHGSALRWRDKTLLFMGVSGSGKSTLAAQLAAADAAYLGDDLVALLGSGCRVHPLPFAPSIKEGAWPVVAPHFPSLETADIHYKGDLRVRYIPDVPFFSGKDAGPPDLLVFPRFAPGRAPKLVHLTVIESLLELSRAGLWLAPDGGTPLLDWACDCPAVALGHSGDLDQTRTLLAEALAQVSTPD